ncbi:hypothetical protein M2132_001804 [Dysgonomonas sp. PH5-45]|uniref:hypothetical protein n=1 Tax=unclassified Dysgonomonas TaxID=2630389 RepID=UPI002473FD16|nr:MULTISPECIES: hypothetical protein [unclassified Dysgonomonas]MDH6355461.1 hypothetical protein [Dysgonomonas sp. PH5-45]MDH6388357.1 hypothetical protein [Dysgonomonas sp. PH5-37]
MKTNLIQELPLTHSGYVGLQVAQKLVHKVLKGMTGITPIRLEHRETDSESAIIFAGNGIVATLHIQKINFERKGGAL